MKGPSPSLPAGAPEGTKWFGGPIKWTRVSLTCVGDDVDPAIITSAMSVSPTTAWAKGDLVRATNPEGGRRRNGYWSLEQKAEDTDEWDVDEALKSLIQQLPTGDAAWAIIPSSATVRLWAVLELASGNQGLEISPQTAAWCAQRGVGLSIDVYRDD